VRLKSFFQIFRALSKTGKGRKGLKGSKGRNFVQRCEAASFGHKRKKPPEDEDENEDEDDFSWEREDEEDRDKTILRRLLTEVQSLQNNGFLLRGD